MSEPQKRIIIQPRRIDLPIQRMDSRLSHEHDQNDAIKARLGWYREFKEFLQSGEDHAIVKVEKKIIENQMKTSANMFNLFIWANIYAALLILVLKLTHVI